MTRRESHKTDGAVFIEEDKDEIEEIDGTLPGISPLGFTTDMLNFFIEECGGREAISERSIAYMCKYYVLRLTNSKKITYCEELSHEPECAPFVGKATIMISTSSRSNFLAIADILVNKFTGVGFIWWDMFCSNHHASPFATYSSEW